MFFFSRPKPRHFVGEVIIIPPPYSDPFHIYPEERYMAVHSRQWVKAKGKWRYHGPILAVMSDGKLRPHIYDGFGYFEDEVLPMGGQTP